jgi:hypothetical protein
LNDAFTETAEAEPRPPEYLVKATFWPVSDTLFQTFSGAWLSREIAEEAAGRMLCDPRVVCVEIIEN